MVLGWCCLDRVGVVLHAFMVFWSEIVRVGVDRCVLVLFSHAFMTIWCGMVCVCVVLRVCLCLFYMIL